MTVENIEDKMEIVQDALIQHGPLSNRIYLMKLNDAQPDCLIKELDNFAEEKGYTKIFAKIPESKLQAFKNANFKVEAEIPGFYNGSEAAVFIGKYFDPQRKVEDNDYEQIMRITKSKSVDNRQVRSDLAIRRCVLGDVSEMAEVYKEVFPSYPFPIFNPEYLAETMESHVVYYCIEIEGRIVALSSAEMDLKSQNAEMTDFATVPAMRGQGLAFDLLKTMESEMDEFNIKTAYTIARAVSPGMNITFFKAGYQFGGRLINNTNISGQIESMNVWYKSI